MRGIDLIQTFFNRQLGHSLNVQLVAMNAAGRQQTEDVQGFAAAQRDIDRAAEHRILEKRAIRDSLVDAGEILGQQAARPQMQMPHLGISHLLVRQADYAAGAIQQGVAASCPQAVPIRRFSQCDRVAGFRFPVTKSVKNKKHDGFRTVRLHSIIPNLVP